ncbi:hypothetical protein ES707_00362 [subsurface metagenome]
MKKRTGDDWFPFWIDKWLLGSTRDELTIEQCAVWVDFLALSYKDEGYIRANEGIPYPIKRLSGLLNRPVKLIQATIDRCLEPKINKLRLESDGTLYVISHPDYELSKRHKRRLSEGDVRQNGHDVQKTDTKSREEESREEESREEYLPEFESFWKNYPKKKEKKDAYITWKTLTKKQKEQVIVAAKHYKMETDALEIDANYIKNPKTFLNKKKEKWKDYLEPPKIKKKLTHQERDEKRTKEWYKEED